MIVSLGSPQGKRPQHLGHPRLCGSGALSGLGFGLIEGNWYAYGMYVPSGVPFSVYLLRFFTSAPLHGVWAALSAVWAYVQLHETTPTTDPPPGAQESARGVFICAILCSSVVHGLYNALIVAYGPLATLPVIFATVLALWAVARGAWGREGRGHADEARASWRRVLREAQIRTGSFAVLFLLASFALPYASTSGDSSTSRARAFPRSP